MKSFGEPWLGPWRRLSFDNRSINVVIFRLEGLWGLRADSRGHDGFHQRRVALTVHRAVGTVPPGACQAVDSGKVAHCEGGALRDDDAASKQNTIQNEHSCDFNTTHSDKNAIRSKTV